MSAECFRLVGPWGLEATLPPWAGQFPQFDAIVGYSDLGHAFLAHGVSGEYAVLHPYRAAAKGYGVFGSPAEFADQVLRDPGFTELVLLPGHVEAIRERLGPLGEDEVYIATPYPFLGGSEAPDTYDIGNVWVFLDVVAQAQGL